MDLKLLYVFSSFFVACLFLHGADTLLPSDPPPVNDAYKLRPICGRYGWQGGVERLNGLKMMFQNGHAEKTAIWNIPLNKRDIYPETKAVAERRLQLFDEGKIPAVGRIYDCWGKTNTKYPSDEELRKLAENPAFLGFRSMNEWGTQIERAIRLMWHPDKVPVGSHKLIPAIKKFMPADIKEPATREEYEKFARFMWEKAAEPLKGQVHVLDGSHNWAKAWPGGWGPIRSIITENRTPYRNNLVLQALTRGAARMWQVPYGYLQAFDWHARISPPTLDHMKTPKAAYQKERGKLKINPSLYRRLWYYALMGNAAYLGDENDHQRYADWTDSGNYRLSWYGELCEEIQRFNEMYPDLGCQYNPVGLLLSWHNGWAYRGDKAFLMFPYDDGEHMTRELINTTIFKYSELRKPNDEFSATPYGDIFDILRLDTPKGPLPQKLLANYRVLMLVGKHKLGSAELETLKEYVKNGGLLVINAAQFSDGLPKELSGAELGEIFDCNNVITPDGKELKSGNFKCSSLKLDGAKSFYTAPDGKVIGCINDFGKGRVITLGMHWMLENEVRHEANALRRTMIPAMDDLLCRLSAELLPFEVTGDRAKEQLAVQINTKPNGFVAAFYNNDGLIPPEKAFHGYVGYEIVDIHKTITFTVRAKQPMQQVVNLLTHERLAMKNNACTLTVAPGELVILEFSSEPIPAPKITRQVNLALNKNVSGDEGTGNTTGDKAVDGNADFLSAWWSKAACPVRLCVDLGKEETVNAVRVIPAWSENNIAYPRISQWIVEASADGVNWNIVADESKNIMPDTKNGVCRYFAPQKARYIRYTQLFNSTRQGGQLVELQVLGDKTETVEIPWKIDPASLSFPSEVSSMFKRTYLSSGKIKLVSAVQGEKAPAMDKECFYGDKLTIRGRTFEHGIGTHAKSELVYQLDPAQKYRMFTAYVGLDDSASLAGTVDFQIFVDGKKVFSSGKLTTRTVAIPAWADVTGAKELKLVVDDCGDGVVGDIADWADACLRK